MELYLTTYQLDKAVMMASDEKLADQLNVNQLQLHQFRARLAMLQKNLKGCKKEIKSLSVIENAVTHVAFLKANYEYLRGNYRKSVKLLTSAPKTPLLTDAGQCLPSLYFNNLGCLHYHMGKYSLASYYFSKALYENDSALNDFPPLEKATLSGRPLAVLGVNCRQVLLYNLGLQQLYAGQPTAAFTSLLEAVQVFHTNPLLWLRLAETSIAAYNKAQMDYAKQQRYHSDTIQTVVEAGFHQKLVVMPMEVGHLSRDGSSAAMPTPSLDFANICLRNALYLLPPAATTNNETMVSALPCPPLHGDAVMSLRASILANSSYVSLRQGDPVSSLHYSKQLLAIPSLSFPLMLLAHLYGAECCILLGMTGEAIQHLTMDLLNNDHPEGTTPAATGGGVDTSPNHCRASVLMNIASVCCVRKEMEKARKALLQACACLPLPQRNGPLHAKAILLSAYIELHTGNVTGAIQLLRRHQTTTQYNLLTNGSSSQQDKKRLANNNRRVLS
ncbi:CCR4-NOT transcription complex subunit 10-like isoform X3 [Dysidea avara]